MIRLFIALCLDESTRQLLGGLGRNIPGARTVPAEQLHLTLRFIGDVDGAVFHDIKEQLCLLQSPPVTFCIKGVGHFPPRGNPRVLWAGIEPAGAVIMLRNRVNTVLSRCGIQKEQRKFHPHITLARLNRSPAGRVARFLSANSLLELPAATVDTVTLFSSKLTNKGAIHTIEGQFPLQDFEPGSGY
jgi:2'-5' RNA ligase